MVDAITGVSTVTWSGKKMDGTTVTATALLKDRGSVANDYGVIVKRSISGRKTVRALHPKKNVLSVSYECEIQETTAATALSSAVKWTTASQSIGALTIGSTVIDAKCLLQATIDQVAPCWWRVTITIEGVG